MNFLSLVRRLAGRRRALAASKTHTDRRRISLRTCLLREVRIFRSFKTAPRDTNPPRACLAVVHHPRPT